VLRLLWWQFSYVTCFCSLCYIFLNDCSVDFEGGFSEDCCQLYSRISDNVYKNIK